MIYQALTRSLGLIHWKIEILSIILYLLEHPLGVGNAGGLLPGGAPVGEVVARGELVHGDHGGAGLLAPQLQHREQVQGHRAHVGQGPHLRQQQLVTRGHAHQICVCKGP